MILRSLITDVSQTSHDNIRIDWTLLHMTADERATEIESLMSRLCRRYSTTPNHLNSIFFFLYTSINERKNDNNDANEETQWRTDLSQRVSSLRRGSTVQSTDKQTKTQNGASQPRESSGTDPWRNRGFNRPKHNTQIYLILRGVTRWHKKTTKATLIGFNT